MPNTKVYHGSPVLVTRPDIFHCRPGAEFGPGFYVTPYPGQAKWWCGGFEHPRMAEYEFDISSAANLNCLHFESDDAEFRDFAAGCLGGMRHGYDIVAGPLIENAACSTCSYDGEKIQICFATQAAIDICLKFIREVPLG